LALRWINSGIAHYVDGYYGDSGNKYLAPLDPSSGYNKVFDHHSLKDYIRHERVTIVIPLLDALDYFKKCLESLIKFTQNYELIIIDNGSDNNTKEYLLECKKEFGFKLQTNENNMGFGYACNQGIKLATSGYICFLNSDTVLTPNWLGKLMKGFNQPNAGILGPSTCYSGGRQNLTGLMEKRFSMGLADIVGCSLQLKEEYTETEIFGFCYLVKREVIDKLGGFDYKSFGFGNYEESDFNHRARLAGYKTYCAKGAYVHHYGSITFESAGISQNKLMRENISKLKEAKKLGKVYVENDVKIDNDEKIDVIIPVLDRKEETIKTLESLILRNKNINILIITIIQTI